MKRNVSKVLSVLLIAALMLSFTAVASAETRMYATRAVNVRSGPGTGYGVVTTLKQGDEVKILAQFDVDGTKWGCIKNGWVCMDYVGVG